MSQSEIENMDKKLHVTNSSLVTINFIIQKICRTIYEILWCAYESCTGIRKRNSQEAALPSHIRFFHSASNTPAVDILVNGQKVIKNISFKQFSPYLTLVQGKYRIDIVPVGNETPIFSALVPIMGNHTYTFAAINSDNHLQLQPMLDNTHLPAGQAKIRFAHFSPDTLL